MHIHGMDTVQVNGKTTKQKQSRAQKLLRTKVSKRIMEKNRKVYLMTNYLIVQGIKFLTTISNRSQLRTVGLLPCTKGDLEVCTDLR